MSYPFALLLVDSARGRAYLQGLCNAGTLPAEVLLMPGEWKPPRAFTLEERKRIAFDPTENVRITLERHGLGWTECKSADINSSETIEVVRHTHSDLIIFGGPSGQILRKPVLSQGKSFLHAHPGRLPDFRGSTTIYYAILHEGRCGVSVIVFNEGIDTGAVVVCKEFPAPDQVNVDYLYDPNIRAATMVEAIRKVCAEGKVTAETQQADELPYYIIHPVLKHAALLAARAW